MLLEAKARARFVRMSPRKARLVVDLVRGMQVDQALSVLGNVPKRAADPIRKVIKSAAANAISAVGTARLKAEDLEIATITVDGGPTFKRYRAASLGRANPIRHPLSHVTVVVRGEAREEGQRRKQKAKKAKAEKTEEQKTADR